MDKIIEDFFGGIVRKTLEAMTDFGEDTFSYYLNFDKAIKSAAPSFSFDKLYTYMAALSLGIAIMLFLKKGFEIYILWNDGDADLDPVVFLASFIKMTVVIVWFSSAYGYGVEVATNIFNKLLESITGNVTGKDFLAGLLNFVDLNNGFLFIIFIVVLLINAIRLVIQFFGRGIELFILRIGVPLAALDMLNADSVAWRAYVKKIVQITLTLELQIFLFFLSLMIPINGIKNFIFAIAIQLTAIKLPSFLSELLVVSAGNGGLISKASSGAHLVSSLKSIFKK
jgi:hypothetical protein